MRVLALLLSFVGGSMLTVVSVQQTILRQAPSKAAFISYNVREDGYDLLYTASPDGSNPVVINTSDRPLFDADYAPDGSWLVAVGFDDINDSIYRIDARTGDTSLLIPDGGNEQGPVISPDGTQVAFTRTTPSGTNLYVYHLADETTTQLTFDDAFNQEPTWTPDGQSLIFVRRFNTSSQLYRYDFADGEIAAITSNTALLHGSPVVSPDGRWIAFIGIAIDPETGRPNRTQHIYTISWDGTILNQLTFGQRNDLTPDWSADGEWVYFASYNTALFSEPVSTDEAELATYNIHRVAMDGSREEIVLRSTDNESNLTLSPPVDSNVQLAVWTTVGVVGTVGAIGVWGRFSLQLIGAFLHSRLMMAPAKPRRDRSSAAH